MNKKVGRNDPCSCGSGKKFKNCCLLKEAAAPKRKQKMTAKWLNQPHVPNLIERTFGNVIEHSGKTFNPPTSPSSESKDA